VQQQNTLETITCVSVQQHYADDIFFAGKWAENRSWSTPYRGELWIHSSRIADGVIAEHKEDGIDLVKESPTGLMVGVILGRVQLIECIERPELMAIAPDEFLQAIGETRPTVDVAHLDRLASLLKTLDVATWEHVGDSSHVWILAAPEMLHEPIPVGGKLRLWKMPVETERLALASPRKRKWKMP